MCLFHNWVYIRTTPYDYHFKVCERYLKIIYLDRWTDSYSRWKTLDNYINLINPLICGDFRFITMPKCDEDFILKFKKLLTDLLNRQIEIEENKKQCLEVFRKF